MGTYVLKRLLAAIPTLLIAAVLVFSFIHLIPGDPASVMLGDMATVEEIEALRRQLGLDQPLWEQFIVWLSNAIQGDLGTSIYFQEPVLSVIGEGAETSLFLALLTMLLIVLIGIPAGILSAAKHGTRVDQTLSGLTMLFASIPTFWLGLYLIFTVAVGLRLLPTSGFPSILEEKAFDFLVNSILSSIIKWDLLVRGVEVLEGLHSAVHSEMPVPIEFFTNSHFSPFLASISRSLIDFNEN